MSKFNSELVGGIYTVVRTKSKCTVSEYGQDYCLIGPLHAGSSKEVEFMDAPEPIEVPLSRLREHGMHLKFGKWLVEGSPNIILVDIDSCSCKENEIVADIWDSYGIPMHADDKELRQYATFGYSTFAFLQEVFSPLIID